MLGIINGMNRIVYKCLVPTLKLAYITGCRITDSLCFCMTALKDAVKNLEAYYKDPIISSDFPYFVHSNATKRIQGLNIPGGWNNWYI